MSPHTIARRTVGLLVAALLVAPFGLTPAAGSACAGVRDTGPWRVISRPEFPAGSQTLTDHLAYGAGIVVTNGTAVMVGSADGCNWTASYVLPAAASGNASFTADNSEIRSLNVLGRNRPGARIAIVIHESVGPLGRSHVVTGTPSGGGNWRVSDGGLPPVGAPTFFASSPSDGDVAYIGLDVVGQADLLYATTDGGGSWSLRAPLTQDLTELDVDPLDPNDLWGAGPTGLFHSTDGGAAFTPIPDFANAPAGPVDVFHVGSASARLVVGRPGNKDVQLSIDGGGIWFQVPTPGDVSSIAQGEAPLQIAISAGGKVLAYHAPSFSWIDLSAPIRGVVDLLPATGGGLNHQGRTADAVVVFRGPDPGSLPPEVLQDLLIDIPLLQTSQIPEAGSASLSPVNNHVKLGIGEKRTVPYKLTLPRRPLPLDVVFLLDTSSSMTKFTEGLAEAYADIINGLVRSGIDARFGLAEHRAYPDFFPPRENEPNFVYRRRLDIPATSDDLRQVLTTLETAAGGRYDAQLGALYQIATGAGQDLQPEGSSAGHDVPPGQGLSFRAKALRVVILGTDEPFGERGPERDATDVVDSGSLFPPDIPSFEETIAALNQKDILQIGVAVGSDADATVPDLERVARGTGALAPDTGVDCDGDGIQDLAGGDPLVCTLNARALAEASNLVPAIVNLVEAVPSQAVVGLETSGAERVVSNVSPGTHDGVVLQASRPLRFAVTYRCAPADAGRDFAVKLAARTANRTLASATARVSCTDEPVFDPPLTISLLAPLAAAVVIPPPVPPPSIPVSTQITSQAQFNASAATAAQKEEQPQLAFVHARHAEMEQMLATEEYEMSSYQRRTSPQMPPSLPLGAAAVMMAFAYGAASRARERVRVARVGR